MHPVFGGLAMLSSEADTVHSFQVVAPGSNYKHVMHQLLIVSYRTRDFLISVNR